MTLVLEILGSVLSAAVAFGVRAVAVGVFRQRDALSQRNSVGPAAASGLPREEYLRSLIMGKTITPRPCTHHADLLRKVAGLCNNANQLAHVANASGMASEQSIQEMLRLTKETWQLVKEEW